MPIQFKNIFKKRQRPLDVFGSIKKPHLEEAYIKFPGKRLKAISKRRKTQYVRLDESLIEKLQKKYGKEHTHIHTHPESDFIPSVQDLINFLGFEDRKTAIIVPLDKKTNEPKGYFVMRKNRNYEFSKIKKEDFSDSMQTYSQNSLSERYKELATNLKSMAKKYNFSYRFFLAKGVTLVESARGFKSSRESLETKLLIISFIFLSLSIIFSSSSITGNVISEVSSKTSNTISVGLFIAGLCFAELVFFFRNNT